MVLGRIGAAHGIRGWVRVQSFTDPPEALLDYGAWRASGGRQLEIEERRWDGKQLRVRFRGIADRTAAEKLNGLELEVERAALPALSAGQYYRDDLLGFRVQNLAGIELGVLDHFVDAPAQAVMVVRGEREHWVPVTAQHLRKVELDGRRIEVDWPEDL